MTGMPVKTSRMPDKIMYTKILVIIGALAVLITGIALLSTFKIVEPIVIERKINYEDCIDIHELPCKNQAIDPDDPCSCLVKFEIKDPIEKPVGFYYELESFDQNRNDYKTSRDDNQLAGFLSPTPAPSCGNYSYDETSQERKPIAPCGAIADSMFTDKFEVFFVVKHQKINIHCINTDLYGITEGDRKLYRNPPGDLKEALQNFSKPKSWYKYIWELDTQNSSNNGFQNEAFIAWMKTDLKRKPICRFNHTDIFEQGLPVGDYLVAVKYLYSPVIYSGPRTLILAHYSSHMVTSITKLVIGIIFLILGIAVLIITYVISKFNISIS